MSVTAAELARRLNVSPRTFREWLRKSAAAEHPLLQGHAHSASWVFSDDDAERLASDFQGVRHSATRHAARRSTDDGIGGVKAAAAAVVAAQLRRAVHQPAHSLDDSPPPLRLGLYAWWARPGLLSGVHHPSNGPTLTTDGKFELVYVGIAARSSLNHRLRSDHLGKQTGHSTLRRALGAWAGEEIGLSTEWRSGRVQHTRESEEALTQWMRNNLYVSWIEHPAPDHVEPKVIQILLPPLNHKHNKNHPNWTTLDDARSRWAAAWRPTPTSVPRSCSAATTSSSELP